MSPDPRRGPSAACAYTANNEGGREEGGRKEERKRTQKKRFSAAQSEAISAWSSDGGAGQLGGGARQVYPIQVRRARSLTNPRLRFPPYVHALLGVLTRMRVHYGQVYVGGTLRRRCGE